MKAIKLLAVDLDGTFLDPGELLTETVRSEVARLQQKGIRVVTASARSRNDQERILYINNVENGFFNALIANEHHIHFFERGQYVAHRSWNDNLLSRWNHLLPEAWELCTYAATYAKDHGMGAKVFPDDEAARLRGIVGLWFEHLEDAEAVRLAMLEHLRNRNASITVNRNGRLFQIIDEQANKGLALQEVARHWRIPPEEVLAIGDSVNDIEMLNGTFGFQAATVGNATDDMKDLVRSRGGVVAKRECSGGVVEILRGFL